MDNWVLYVELDGEWERCGFATRGEALATFVALAKDYSQGLGAAVLTVAGRDEYGQLGEMSRPGGKQYVN